MAKPVIATVGQLDLGGSCAKWAKGFRDSGMSEILKISAIFGFYSDFLNFSIFSDFFDFLEFFLDLCYFFCPLLWDRFWTLHAAGSAPGVAHDPLCRWWTPTPRLGGTPVPSLEPLYSRP